MLSGGGINSWNGWRGDTEGIVETLEINRGAVVGDGTVVVVVMSLVLDNITLPSPDCCILNDVTVLLI